MNYTFLNTGTQTPQTKPIPGRAYQMRQGQSGGYQFDAGNWVMLRRCLLIGTAQGTFYAHKQLLTQEFITILNQCIADDPDRVAEEILVASQGKSINNSAPILAMVLLSMGTSKRAKDKFLELFPQVVRTGSHFYEWLNYTKSLRGFGKVVRESGRLWLTNPNTKALAYQLLKYQQRHGFTHRDALRLFHVKPPSDVHQDLFNWAVNGWDTVPKAPSSEAIQQIWWYETVKRNPKKTHEAITKGRLTHEMIAPIGVMDQKAWELLFKEMPIGALLRNLGSLTEIGVLAAHKKKSLQRVETTLCHRSNLRNGKIHPIDLLKALKTYASGGKIGRSRKTWIPIPRVIDCLEKALELSFETQKPTGKVFLHALDVSGSMSYYTLDSIGLSCCEVATTMALATAKAEKNYMIRGFSTQFVDLKITARDSFRSATAKATMNNFGGTDASVAYDWAIKHRFYTDVFCFWTDCESWAGRQHPSEALARYRQKVNPMAKAIYITLVPNQLSMADPNDPYSWDFHGFDPSAPKAIQMIAQGL